MSAIFTVEEVDTQIEAYKAALLALSRSKQYTIAGRTVTREDLPEIRETLSWLQTEKDKVTNNIGVGRTYARPVRS